MRYVSTLFTIAIGIATAGNGADAHDNRHLVTSRRPATRWEEAFVTGNGRMGAMLYGTPECATMVANHCRLFLPLGSREVVPDLAGRLPELRTMIREQGSEQALAYLLKCANEQEFPGLTPTDPFHPGFFLHIRNTPAGPVEEYLRSQNLRTGEVMTSWRDRRGKHSQRLFVSRNDNAIVLSLTGPGPGLLNCELQFPPVAPDAAGRLAHGWTAPVDSDLLTSRQSTGDQWVAYHNLYTRGKGGYDAAIRMVCRGGKVRAENSSVRVSAADNVLLIMRIVPWKTPLPRERSEAWAYSPVNPDFSERIGHYQPVPALAESSVVPFLTSADAAALAPRIQRSLANVPADYGALLQTHARLHAELFDRAALDLGGVRESSQTTEDLLDLANREKRLPPALAEQMYNAGRYMFICCAGELPPNLQGIWTGTWKPAWSGDFTLDSNLELAIQHAFSGNLAELMAGYYRMIESFYPEWRLNAERTYGCRGYLSNARASNTALLLHWGKWPGVFWTGGSPWLSHFFYDHWQYTGDAKFLEQRTLPLLKEVASFYEDFVVTSDETGKLEFLPSYSPETRSGITATMDVMLCKETLRSLIETCRLLEKDLDQVPKWEGLLDQLPAYRVNDDGALAEWILPGFGEKYSHRHLSHLYACHDASDDPDLESSRELWEAAQKAVRLRIDSEGEASSHGRMHQGLAAAYLGMAEAAYGRLEIMATTRSIFTSLMCAHEPDRKIFNVDANGAIPELIHRMLVRSRPGQLDLLPALPRAWPAGEIRGIRAQQQVLIRRLAWDRAEGAVALELVSEKNQTITLRTPGSEARQVTLPRGEVVEMELGF